MLQKQNNTKYNCYEWDKVWEKVDSSTSYSFVASRHERAWLFGILHGTPHIQGALELGKAAIALQVQVKTLEERCDPGNAITAPLNRFDLVVQALHEATVKPVNKVVDYVIQPVIECRQEFVEASQCLAADFSCPLEQPFPGCFFGQRQLEYSREFLTESIGQFQLGRILE